MCIKSQEGRHTHHVNSECVVGVPSDISFVKFSLVLLFKALPHMGLLIYIIFWIEYYR
jgi:hypothetical protein